MSDAPVAPHEPSRGTGKVSDELDRWLTGDRDKTLGSLIELFGEKSFAIVFVLLLGVPALRCRPAAPPMCSRSSPCCSPSSVERLSKPRLHFLFDHRLSNIVFGLLVIGASLGAFFAPPFTGLDTLPSLGGVLLSLGVLLKDILIVLAALVVGVGAWCWRSCWAAR